MMSTMIRSALLLAAAVFINTAQANTIDFESYPVGNFAYDSIPGFEIWPDYDTFSIADDNGDKYLSYTGSGFCDPYGDCGSLTLRISAANGGPFAFYGVDFEAWAGHYPEDLSYGFYGVTMSDEIVTDINYGSGDWLNLKSLNFGASTLGMPGSPETLGMKIDNLQISAIPIPAAAWLFMSGLGALAWRRKH